jgi:hypothetical protein
LEKPKTPFEAARNGMKFFSLLQNHDGHFAAEYGGQWEYTIEGILADWQDLSF